MSREVERFIAKTDKGKEYTIIHYQEYLTANDFDGEDEIEGLEGYTTSEGLFVNRIDSKTFQIVETNEVVRKVT
jgi:hypothetical protein